MEELFRRLFGITSGIQDQSVAQAFPIGQGQVDIQPISAGDMPIAQPVVPQNVPQGFSASQFLPSMDAMRNALPSMENLRGIIPAFAGLEGRINEAITPQLPAYMQGLLGTEVEAQLPEQARRAGLLNAAAALMQASGPQDRRISLGQALGAGLQGYQQGAQGAFDQTLQGLKIRSELTPKPTKLTGEYANIAQLLYGTDDPAKLPKEAVSNIINRVNMSKASGAPKVEIKQGESLAGQIGPMLKDSQIAASGAAIQVDAADRVISAIDSGNVIAGPGTTPVFKLAQIGSVLGITGKDTNEVIANTRTAIRGLAELTLQGRKSMRGEGSITESEGALAQRAFSGDVAELTTAEIKQLANASKRVANFNIAQHNKKLDTLRRNPAYVDLVPFYEVGAMPSAQMPPNVTVRKKP
jgi:hypothetical protein